MGNPITNEDLYNDQSKRTDHLFIITNEPNIKADEIIIQVDLNQQAGVLDKVKENYKDQKYTEEQIRKGINNYWLLSGGTIIKDHSNRIALGLRDGNAADPFVFTNIGAGRCDQDLQQHCLQEMYSEFILCIKRSKKEWHQIKFSNDTPDLRSLYNKMPTINKAIEEIISSNFKLLEINNKHIYKKLTNIPNTRKVVIIWGNKKAKPIQGYVWIDEDNRTIEFRLPILFNLSRYKEVKIFFGEGTGYATWKSVSEINGLILAQKFWQQRLVTPFLEYFAW